MNMLLLLLVGLAIATVLGWSFFIKRKHTREAVFSILQTAGIYYLSLQLFIYGCDKLFKAQFYLPEPNILYTPLGKISKDLLFWSSMGSAHLYNVFMGSLEVLPAILLWFRKTRVLGLLIALGVLLNIVFINLGFDISVKLYSIFLWGLCAFLLWPNARALYQFFILKKTSTLPATISINMKQEKLRMIMKVLLIGLILAEGLYPYLARFQFNDDTVPRPYLHGAYQVEAAYLNDSLEINFDIKRLFIHRQGYLIFENQEAEMVDYRLLVDSSQQQLLLIDYYGKQTTLDYVYTKKDSLLELEFFYENQFCYLKTKVLDWRKLPLLQDDFHWTIEAVK